MYYNEGNALVVLHVKDPSGLVPLVNQVGRLRQASAETTDPHVLVTWVKKIGGHAQLGNLIHRPGKPAGVCDAHSVSVVAFQPRSPAEQAGRGLTRLVYYTEGVALSLGEPRPFGAEMDCVGWITPLERSTGNWAAKRLSGKASPSITWCAVAEQFEYFEAHIAQNGAKAKLAETDYWFWRRC